MNIGVDHMAAYIPNQYLALEDLALARNVDPKKFLVGLGNREMAIASTRMTDTFFPKSLIEENIVKKTDRKLFMLLTISAKQKRRLTPGT